LSWAPFVSVPVMSSWHHFKVGRRKLSKRIRSSMNTKSVARRQDYIACRMPKGGRFVAVIAALRLRG